MRTACPPLDVCQWPLPRRHVAPGRQACVGRADRESRVSREYRRIDDRDRVPSPLMDRALSSPRMDQRMPSPRRLVSTSSPPPYTSQPRARAQRRSSLSEHAWNARVGMDEGRERR